MWTKIPDDLLENLKCVHCGRYLNVTPVMVNKRESQICGKCFKILPSEEKKGCVRQVAYEKVVARIFSFPCQYKSRGCDVEFPLNQAENHELLCPFRLDALDLSCDEDRSTQAEENRLLLRHPRVYYQNNAAYVGDETCRAPPRGHAIDHGYESHQFKTPDPEDNLVLKSGWTTLKEPAALKYDLRIYDNKDKRASLNLNCDPYRPHLTPVASHSTLSYENLKHIPCTGPSGNHSDEININEQQQLENVYCKFLAQQTPREEALYETIASRSTSSASRQSYHPKCSNCQANLNGEIYHCVFGHDVCKKCRHVQCNLCASPIDLSPKYYCKNYFKGCRVYFLSSDQNVHTNNCEFSQFSCLLSDECDLTCATLGDLKEHIKSRHLSAIILSNSVVKQAEVKKDEEWIMFAFDHLFKCKRFSYDGEMEFLVEFVGPQVNAKEFKYEILVKSADNKQILLTKSMSCFEWCASALDRALVITKKELEAKKLKKFNFTYTLVIAKTLKHLKI